MEKKYVRDKKESLLDVLRLMLREGGVLVANVDLEEFDSKEHEALKHSATLWSPRKDHWFTDWSVL